MKLSIYLFLFLMGILSQAAMGADLGFRYVERYDRCLNKLGREGRNPDFLGECGIRTNVSLPRIDLSGRMLRGIDFSRSNLIRANMIFANLRGALLLSTNLSKADVTGADFYHAKFNAKTLLPFSRQRAKQLGMIFVNSLQ